jgi:arylsulfatase A-like enzyme
VDDTLSATTYTHTAYQRYLKKFLRCVRGVDDNIARLLKHLEDTGELDNTIVVYTADQGFMLGEHDYIDKRWIYEESLRVPFIVRYPAWMAAGTRLDALVNNTDFAPTLLAMAGVKAPSYMQGRSFLPMLRGEAAPTDWREATYYRYWMHMAHHDNPAHYGIRTKTHKLVFFYGLPLDAPGAEKSPTAPHWELYDLVQDPHEMTNVVADPAYTEVLTVLKAQLRELKSEVGDTDEKYPELVEVVAKYWNGD